MPSRRGLACLPHSHPTDRDGVYHRHGYSGSESKRGQRKQAFATLQCSLFRTGVKGANPNPAPRRGAYLLYLLVALLANASAAESAEPSPELAGTSAAPAQPEPVSVNAGVSPAPRTCDDPDGASCTEAPAPVPAEQAPPIAEWVRTGAELLSPELLRELSANISKLNTSTRHLCYLALMPNVPNESVSPSDFARRTMREWFGGNRSYDRTVLVLVLTELNRTEIATGSRVRKKIKQAAARRITRKANHLLAEGELETAVRHCVKQAVAACERRRLA